MPSSTFNSGTVTTVGNQSTYSGQNLQMPGPTFHATFPTSGLMIRCYRDATETTAATYDASFVLQTLSTKYHSHGQKRPSATPVPQSNGTTSESTKSN
jgi:hypothetical protein